MSETGPARGAKKGGGVKLAVLAGVAIASVAALYVIQTKVFKRSDAAPPTASASAEGGPYAKFAVGKLHRLTEEAAGQPAPTQKFFDAAGKEMTLADLKGQPMLLNVWATWCAPCRQEMPTLADLQKRYQGKLKVVAISIDKTEQTQEAKDFIAKNAPLDFYQEPTLNLPFAFKVPLAGYPTSILYDANGVEQARVVAEMDWSVPEAHALIDKLIGE